MEPSDPLTLITETWMTSRIDFWSFLFTALAALIVLVVGIAMVYATWSPEVVQENYVERRTRLTLKTLGFVVIAGTIILYVLVALPLTLQKQKIEHSGQYVLVNAPLASAEVIDEATFAHSRQIGVWVDGSDYVLMLEGDDGLAFLQQEAGSPVHLYCDPDPQGTSLKCSTTSSVDERRMAMEGVYDYQSTSEAFSGLN